MRFRPRESKHHQIWSRNRNISMRGRTNKLFKKVDGDSRESRNLSSFGRVSRNTSELGRAK